VSRDTGTSWLIYRYTSPWPHPDGFALKPTRNAPYRTRAVPTFARIRLLRASP